LRDGFLSLKFPYYTETCRWSHQRLQQPRLKKTFLSSNVLGTKWLSATSMCDNFSRTISFGLVISAW
jgi:hypothetical protein